MTEQLKASITRIFTTGGAISGAGFLISEKHILTCAHVVAKALGISENEPEIPTGKVHIDLPFVAPGQKLAARVVFWKPVQQPEEGGDLAGLELENAFPDHPYTVKLIIVPDSWNRDIRAFGFPKGHDNGVWAEGFLKEKEASGWLQINCPENTGYCVAQGFSGTPVWDEKAHGVVGMVVAIDNNPAIRSAYLIPTEVLIKSWPLLEKITVVQTETEAEQARKRLASAIIHGGAVTSAGFAALFAQGAWFGADTPILTAITVGMIISLGKLFDQKVEKSGITTVVGVVLGAALGVTIVKGILGLIPLLGNAANAATTFSLTEAIGWGAYLIFNEGKDITQVTLEDFKQYIKIAEQKVEKPDVQKALNRMPSRIKAQYEEEVKKSQEQHISDTARQLIQEKIQVLIEPYLD